MIENVDIPFVQKSAIDRIFHQQQKKALEQRSSSIQERKNKLKKLEQALMSYRKEIHQALYDDFRKPVAEVDMSEIWPVISEIKHTRRHLHRWAKPQKVKTPLPMLGTSSKIYYEQKGVTLIIAPWNFPINLTLGPLVSAIAAGNTAIVKPSEISANSSRVMQKIIDEIFPVDEVAMVQGGVEETTHLLSLPFDHIFFTGSPAIGKIVMQAAAKNLTSVTLELGGKSPAVIDHTADLKDAAKKLVWGKFMNAGQTCIAPDYLLVQQNIHDELIENIKYYVQKYYGHSPQASDDYARIISQKQFQSQKQLYDNAINNGAENIFEHTFDEDERFMPPAVLTNVTFDMEVMNKEIFGPILPVLKFGNINEAFSMIRKNPNPLAAYIFSKDEKVKKHFVREVPAGGMCINDCLLHYSNMELPFGGNRVSGMGRAHGFYGFQEFSNLKPVLRQRTGFTNMQFLYPPYTKQTEKIINWLIKYI
ncbi:MAG: aldehyde dehydrogenase family protein [Candidatus Cyclobacteriaceae bacterium M2_1C_046]